MTKQVEAGIEESPTGVQVIYDESVLREKAPYQVSVDQERVTLLLLNYGVSQETVNQVKLLVRERPPEQALVPIRGYFDSTDLTLCLYPDVMFDQMRGKPGNSPNHVFLHESKHLINYVTRPDYEIGTNRLFRRVESAVRTYGVISLLIAVGLALPDMLGVRNEQKMQQVTYQIATFSTIYVAVLMSFYHLNPVEWSAQRFAGRLNKSPQWQSIVTISPKGK